MAVDDHIWPVVLAGGIGARFWPVSTRERPKQLLPLVSERPLIVDTIERARALAPDSRIHIVAGEHLAGPFRSALPDLPPSAYLTEPMARGTGPALAWAAWELHRRDPEAVMVCLHSDHLVRPIEAFRETVLAAVSLAVTEDLLLSIAAKPDRVETGFGHLEPGAALHTGSNVRAFRVKAFHEKPDAETAARYVRDGYLWNTGIFVWKASVFLSEVAAHAPALAAALPLLEHGPAAFFAEVPISVVDRDVMERSERVATVEATFAWDDVGSWEALGRTHEPDSSGNVVVGNATCVDGRGNVVFSDHGEVVLWGVDDLVVVRTADRTLVLPRSRASELKTLVSSLEASV